MARPRKYPEELRERAVQLYGESGGRPIAGNPAASSTSSARWKASVDSALVGVQVALAQPVAAAAGREVVERAPEPVVLEIHDVAVADRLADYVDEARGRYPPGTPPDARG